MVEAGALSPIRESGTSITADQKCTFHDLRHTLVSLMAKANALPAEIARHLGHVDGGVLVASRYQHLEPDALEGAQHRLDQLIADTDAGSVRDGQERKVQKPCKQAGST